MVAILVAIMMVVFLGVAALAIDLGSFYQAQRQAQGAADAAALAASQDLPSNTSGAVTDATTYAQRNFPGSTVGVTTNYNSTPKDIKVTVSASSPSFFGKLFGLSQANVSASAVAGGNGKTVQAAIFAYADGGDCTNDIGISIPKNNANITGGIQSNGNITATGHGTTSIGSGVYGTGSGCSCNCDSGNFTNAPYADTPTPYPLDYRSSPPTCTVNITGNYTFTGTVSPGVYCDRTGTFTFSGASGTGVTFEAYGISDTGGTNLTAPGSPGAYGLLLYQTGCDATAGALS
ncbi:MAG: pilus assembly protein TadG-related protein, partial [Actinomycetota bacterium]|nr:pilus assembly protein TadG-related protein [Actinomycetota bacterium]